jgi:hypothetical protein
MTEASEQPAAEQPEASNGQQKPKRPMTDAQRRGLEKAHQAKREKREERMRALAEKHAAAELEEETPSSAVSETVERSARTAHAAFVSEFVADAAVPPDESNLHRRRAPTMEAEVSDMAGDQPVPRNLDDLMSMAPIGDGQYYIAVERKAPRQWSGAQCAGILRKITRYMTTEEFKRTYGGGEYVLVLYGPPKRGGVYDPETRRVRPKALTPAVRFTVPLHEYAPMLFDDLEDEDNEEEGEGDVRYGNAPWVSGRPKSNAEARMFEASLEADERGQARAEQREKERVERERQLQEEAARQGLTMAQLLAQQKESELRRIEAAHQREMEIAERRHQENVALLRTEANKPGETQALGTALKGILEVMKPNGAGDKQLQDLIKSHNDEIVRLQAQIADANARADNRIREAEQRADRAKEEAERRADQRIQDIERRAEERMKESHERSEKRVREVEDAARRVVEDARQQAQARLDDERRNHDRDLAAKNDSHNMRVETLKASYDTRLAAKDEEISRLRTESERHRQEAEAKGDLPTQVQRFAATAEALGYAKDGGGGGDEEKVPTDWKTMLLGLGAELVKQGPAMIQSAGQTVQQLRGQAPQQSATAPYMQPQQRALPPRLHARDGSVFQAASPAFGTEDGAAFMGETTMQRPKYPPGFMPTPQAPAQAAQPVQATVQQPPPQQVQTAAPPPQAQQQQAGVQASADQIGQFRALLESALAQGKDPVELANEIKASVGPQMAQAIGQSVTPESVVASLQQMPDGAQSPLIRREGQKFLRELHQAMQQ